jgi:signal transduction histidine kinase
VEEPANVDSPAFAGRTAGLRALTADDPAHRDEALTRIVDRADHLHRLVEDLLLVTRLEHDDLTELVDTRPTDLEPIARAAVDELAVSGGRRAFTLAADAALPTAMADPDRVRQILAALLENADRYSPSDTPIEVELRAAGDDVEIRVIDHGPGIPASQQDAVFERFHRLEDPLTMRTGGVGVGLFIGRRLATAMHGTLRLEPSPPGTGSTFVLSLPATLGHPSMQPLSPPSTRLHGEP